MAKIQANNKEYLYFTAGTIIIFAIVGIYFYRQGKKEITIAPLPGDNTGDNQPQDIPGLSSLAQEIYNDCNGLNWGTNHDEDIYKRALALNATNFVELYNIWNTKFQPITSETLTEYISDQWSLPGTQWRITKETMIARLGHENLK